MAVKVYHDADADILITQNKRVTFVGFGNHGAAQAHDMHDSGVKSITIGNCDDEYKSRGVAADVADTPGSAELAQLWKESEEEPISQAEKRAGTHE